MSGGVGGKIEAALCALIAGALFPALVAAAGPPANTPQEVILSLYAHHQPKKGKEVDVCDKAAVAKYCDAALTELGDLLGPLAVRGYDHDRGVPEGTRGNLQPRLGPFL